MKYFSSPGGDGQNHESKLHDSPEGEKEPDGCHDASVLESGSTAHCSYKSEVDRMITENMTSVLKSLKKKRSHKCSKRRKNGDHKEKDCPLDTETVVVVEATTEKGIF